MRFLSISLPIILAVILTIFAVSQVAVYPMPPDGISGEKYDDFSGVLTIAIEKKLTEQFPTLQRWIIEITNLFEKSNKGIYLRTVDLTDDNRNQMIQSAQPADIIISGAGDFSGNTWQAVGEYDLMPAFSSSDTIIPISAGGYLLGINSEVSQSLTELPAESVGWNETLSTVWIALCEQFSPESTEKRTISTPDIGLPTAETPIPTVVPVTGTQISRESLCIGTAAELFSSFLAGKISALPLNENQVAKIRSWQSDGKYQNIRFLNAALFTDRVAYAAIPVSARDDGADRAAASKRFLQMLLSDTAQAGLEKYGMFPVAMIASIYESTPGMRTIENSLRRSDCVVQGAQETVITADFDSFLDGKISAREIMRSLRNFR